MPHNITGTNTFTNPVPAYSDGDPVAQVSNDGTIQALANRDTNLTTRLAVLEGQNLNSRIATLEALNISSRLTAIEALETSMFKAWAVVNFTAGVPSLGEHVFINAVSINSGSLQCNGPSNFSTGTYGVFVQPLFDWSINPSVFAPNILATNSFQVTGLYLGGGGSYSPSGINFGNSGTSGHLLVGVVAT